MHFLIIGIGLLIGLYGLYRFLMKASARQVRALFLTAAVLAVTVALFTLAITGRLPAAIGIVAAMLPIALSFWHRRMRAQDFAETYENNQNNPPIEMSKDEALEVLGLENSASEEDIKAAHKRLIKKLHPDQEGSAWLAAKINAAKDFLLDK